MTSLLLRLPQLQANSIDQLIIIVLLVEEAGEDFFRIVMMVEVVGFAPALYLFKRLRLESTDR